MLHEIKILGILRRLNKGSLDLMSITKQLLPQLLSHTYSQLLYYNSNRQLPPVSILVGFSRILRKIYA